MNVKAQVLELEQLFTRIGSIVKKVGESGDLSITARGALGEIEKSASQAFGRARLCSTLIDRKDNDAGFFDHFHTRDDILEAIGKAKHVYFFAAEKYFRVYKSSAIRVMSSLFDDETVIATMSDREGDLVLSIHL